MFCEIKSDKVCVCVCQLDDIFRRYEELSKAMEGEGRAVPFPATQLFICMEVRGHKWAFSVFRILGFFSFSYLSVFFRFF